MSKFLTDETAPFIDILTAANPVVGDASNWHDAKLAEVILTHTGLVNALRMQAATLASVRETNLTRETFRLYSEGALTTAFMVGYFAAKSEQPQYKN